MGDEEVKIRDGSVLDVVRTNALLYRCLVASPDVYPTSLAEGYSQYLSPTVLRGFLDFGGHLLVAEKQLRMVGFTCGVPDSLSGRFGTYYGAWVAVDPAERLRGIGSRLVRGIEARAFAGGCHKFYVLVQVMNAPALKFFQSLGYASEGILRHHWNGYDFHFMSYFGEQD